MALSGTDERLRRAGEQNPPMMDHHKLVAHRLHILDDVGGEQHQPLLCRPGEQVAEMDALLRVQPHRGLVEDQEGRAAQQGLGDAQALALAAGEGADLSPGLLPQVDGLHGLLDSGLWVPQALEGGHIL